MCYVRTASWKKSSKAEKCVVSNGINVRVVVISPLLAINGLYRDSI